MPTKSEVLRFDTAKPDAALCASRRLDGGRQETQVMIRGTVSYVSIERLKSCRIRPLQFLEEDTDERPDHSGVPSSLSKRNYSSIQERNGGRGGIT